MISWVTGGIVVVHMTVHSASMSVADERHFGHRDGGWFVLLLLVAKHAAVQRYFWRQKISKLDVGIHIRYLLPVYSSDVIVTTQNISNPFTIQVSRVW